MKTSEVVEAVKRAAKLEERSKVKKVQEFYFTVYEEIEKATGSGMMREKIAEAIDILQSALWDFDAVEIEDAEKLIESIAESRVNPYNLDLARWLAENATERMGALDEALQDLLQDFAAVSINKVFSTAQAREAARVTRAVIEAYKAFKEGNK